MIPRCMKRNVSDWQAGFRVSKSGVTGMRGFNGHTDRNLIHSRKGRHVMKVWRETGASALETKLDFSSKGPPTFKKASILQKPSGEPEKVILNGRSLKRGENIGFPLAVATQYLRLPIDCRLLNVKNFEVGHSYQAANSNPSTVKDKPKPSGVQEHRETEEAGNNCSAYSLCFLRIA